MNGYYRITREFPAWIVLMTKPFVLHWRLTLVVLGPLWLSVVFYLFQYGSGALDSFLSATALVALLVGFSWMSMWLPWEDIDRLVRYLTAPREQRRQLRRFDKQWATCMASAGLSRKDLAGNGDLVIPPLYGLAFNDLGQLVARPGLLIGQTVDDWEAAADVLRTAVGADRLRVVPNPSRTALDLVYSFGDMLSAGFTLELPAPDEASPWDSVQLGFTEDGEEWVLPTRISTLVAGSTGAGKSGIQQGLITALGPNIASGIVQLQGIDLKGGMELTMSGPMFTRLATEQAEAVVLLEEAAQQCQARARRMAGHARSHTPTPDEPMVLVVIDELAALVAYSTDRELMRRAEAALAILLTQGRAVGFYVFGFLQDPRKEVLKLRNLFTQAIALRLAGPEEGAMMLGHASVRAGARCENIPRSMPGVAYVLDETGQVTRVRAAHVSDEQIREAAARFPAPTQIPIVVPEPEPSTRTRRPRSEAA